MKLKTLKDLPISPLRKPKGTELVYLDWFKEQLKAEAIKWIRVWQKEKLLKTRREGGSFRDRRNIKINLFKEFHNITSEDLK